MNVQRVVTEHLTFDVPALDVDRTYGRNHPGANGRLERRIVAALLQFLSDAGWRPLFVWDGQERVSVADAKAAMEVIFNLDESWVHFRTPHGNGTHYVFLVGGNGEDIVSDYSFNAAKLDNFGPLMEQFIDEILPEVI